MVQPTGCHFETNVTNVPNNGTAVQLSSEGQHIQRITFKGTSGNTGDVYLGDSTVTSTTGWVLSPNESLTLDFSPRSVLLSDFFVDAANNNDKLDWVIGATLVTGSGTHIHDVTQGGTGGTTFTDGGVMLGSGTGAFTPMAVLADSEMIVGNGATDPVPESGATLRTSIGVAIGSDVQAFDAQLADLAGLGITDNNLIVADGSNWIALAGGTALQQLRVDSGATALEWATITGGPSQATQAALEAETNEDTYPPPDLIKHSPGVAKVWCQWEQTGAHGIITSHNMTSVTDGSSNGDTDHLWNVDFSGADYVIVGGGNGVSSVGTTTAAQAASGATTETRDVTNAGVQIDTESYIACFGDQ